MAMMGFREYARHRGVTLRAVQKAIEAGRIATVGEGRERKIDAAQADLLWAANTDPAAQSLLYSAGPLPTGDLAAAPAAEPAEDADPPASLASPEYRAARARREEIRRDREQLELDRMRGSLIPLPDAQQVVYTSFRTLRDACMHIGARLKDRCAAQTDAFVVEQLITEEIEGVFSRFDPAKMLEGDDDDDADDAG